MANATSSLSKFAVKPVDEASTSTSPGIVPTRGKNKRVGIAVRLSPASDCLTQSSSVDGTQPILGAIDSTVAHSDGYSARCSWTSRTARSRTSGENLFDFFMAPSSQRLEPPRKAGRFRPLP